MLKVDMAKLNSYFLRQMSPKHIDNYRYIHDGSCVKLSKSVTLITWTTITILAIKELVAFGSLYLALSCGLPPLSYESTICSLMLTTPFLGSLLIISLFILLTINHYKQTQLLTLFDDVGIPHEERKQVFGSPLQIIGFDVDPNSMTITMPQAA
jgi:hypothetical protein